MINTRVVQVDAGERFLITRKVLACAMSWSDPDRNYGDPLPAKLKRKVLRDHNGVCHWCLKPGASVVDHIVNRKAGGSDDESNLAPIHPYPCHNDKTQQEATRARNARKNRSGIEHPGRKRGSA